MTMNTSCCDRCGKSVPNHDFIHYGSGSDVQHLCTQCFNADVAERSGIEDFDNNPLEPVTLLDADGVGREFHFRTRLIGPMLVIDAFELRDGVPAGYQFRLIGDPEEERFALLGRLIQKIRKEIATKFLEDGQHGTQIKDMVVKGLIDEDTSDEADLFGQPTPMLVIDGRDVSWADFGEMLMTFVGFKFKLQILDASEDADQ